MRMFFAASAETHLALYICNTIRNSLLRNNNQSRSPKQSNYRLIVTLLNCHTILHILVQVSKDQLLHLSAYLCPNILHCHKLASTNLWIIFPLVQSSNCKRIPFPVKCFVCRDPAALRSQSSFSQTWNLFPNLEAIAIVVSQNPS